MLIRNTMTRHLSFCFFHSANGSVRGSSLTKHTAGNRLLAYFSTRTKIHQYVISYMAIKLNALYFLNCYLDYRFTNTISITHTYSIKWTYLISSMFGEKEKSRTRFLNICHVANANTTICIILHTFFVCGVYCTRFFHSEFPFQLWIVNNHLAIHFFIYC